MEQRTARRSFTGEGTGEQGVALIMVIVVLMALMVIATPFTVSMRNQSRKAVELLNQERARRDCETLRNELVERLKNTHPDLDYLSPQADDPREWTHGDGLDPLVPDSTRNLTRISSSRATDLQGRVNLNTASIYLLANLLGCRTVLEEDFSSETPSLEVRNAENFPDEGLLWIEGDVIAYNSRTEDTFDELEQGLELANIEFPLVANHQGGAEVLDYRSFLLASYCYKWMPGTISTLPTIESLRNIAVFGEVALERSVLDWVAPFVTVRSGLPAGRRFVNAQRVLGTEEDADGRVLFVENGRYINGGSIVRIVAGDDVHFSMVLRCVPAGANSWAVLLQDPLPFVIHDSAAAVIDVLARHAVNLNTASLEVIAACIEGLSLHGETRCIHRDEAMIIAGAIKRKPLSGWLELDELLLGLVEENDQISFFHREAVLLNGLNSNDALVVGGTAPFAFSSGGYFQIDTAVALDYTETSREAARQFMRDIMHVAPRHPTMHIFHTQAAFEAQRRLIREGRWYMTLPVNLNPPPVRANNPPSMYTPLTASQLAPSTEEEGSMVKLAPLRVEGERTLHFDYVNEYKVAEESSGDAISRKISEDLAGNGSSGGALSLKELPPSTVACDDPEGFITGKEIVRLSTLGDPVRILDGPFARVWPFSIELWYRFDELGGPHYIFDTGIQEEADRIYLFFDGKELVFRVADATMPMSFLDEGAPLEHSAISYDFADLPVEEGTFYHIACMAKGTKPSDLCLFVDGVPRGKRSFQTRLKSPIGKGLVSQNPGSGVQVSAPTLRIKVEDATRFPREGVLKIGRELFEYPSRNEDTFFVEATNKADPFGGRLKRQSWSNDHPATEIVELYGYSSILSSFKIPTGSVNTGLDIGAFQIAIVNNDEVETVPLNVQLSNNESFQIGRGFEYDTIDTLPVLAVDGSALERSAFHQSGGFAVLFSDYHKITITNPETEKQEEWVISGRDDNRPQTDRQSLLCGFEVIEYDGFNGSELSGIVRGVSGGYPKGPPHKELPLMSDPSKNPPGESWGGGNQGTGTGYVNWGGVAEFVRQRAYWTENTLQSDDLDREQPLIFVIPISVDVEQGSLTNLFEDFFAEQIPRGESKPELVQFGLEFNGEGSNEAEWIRYDTIAGDRFARDDPRELRRMDTVLTKYCFSTSYSPDAKMTPFEVNERIRFRAQCGTNHSSHSVNTLVLPTFRTTFSQYDLRSGRPGPRDHITLIDVEGDRETAVVNYSFYNDFNHPHQALIALREGVLGTYERVDIDWVSIKEQLNEKDEGATEEALITQLNLEARDFTRILKFPSGELPTGSPEDFIVGGNLFGDPSPSRGCVDEIRFRSFDTPHPDIPRFARYVLQEEFEEEDTEEILRLGTTQLYYNNYTHSNTLLEELELLDNLPEDAFFLLIGDEIIACTEVDVEDGYVVVLPEGRGCFGTEPGFHQAGEAVVALNFPVLSYLEQDLRAGTTGVLLKDAAGFPWTGAILVENEVIGYNRKEENFLSMPSFKPYGDESERGLFRGRFGTEPSEHPEGTLAYLLPLRYPDFYTPGSDAPELAYFSLGVEAPGAYFSEINWVEKSAGPGADLVVLARVGGRGRWDGDAAREKDLFLFENPAESKRRNWLLRQGDFVELRVFTRYGSGAFDPLDYASNAWKYAPALDALSVECVEPSRVYRHEEWR